MAQSSPSSAAVPAVSSSTRLEEAGSARTPRAVEQPPLQLLTTSALDCLREDVARIVEQRVRDVRQEFGGAISELRAKLRDLAASGLPQEGAAAGGGGGAAGSSAEAAAAAAAAAVSGAKLEAESALFQLRTQVRSLRSAGEVATEQLEMAREGLQEAKALADAAVERLRADAKQLTAMSEKALCCELLACKASMVATKQALAGAVSGGFSDTGAPTSADLSPTRSLGEDSIGEGRSVPLRWLVDASSSLRQELLAVADAATSGRAAMGEEEFLATIAPLHRELARLERPSDSVRGAQVPMGAPPGESVNIQQEVLDCIEALRMQLQEMSKVLAEQLQAAQRAEEQSAAAAHMCLQLARRLNVDLAAVAAEDLGGTDALR